MTIDGIPEPRTTAATDTLLFVLATATVIHLQRIGQRDPWKGGLWTGTFGLAAFSAALGAVMHGFALGQAFERLLWNALSVTAGLAAGMLAVGMIYDRWGSGPARRALPIVVIAAIGLSGARTGAGSSLVPFRIYVAAAAFAALFGYGWMALKGRRPGALLMTSGILLSLCGVAIHLRPELWITVIWTFDHNGIFHLVQMAGLVAMTAGLTESLRHHGR